MELSFLALGPSVVVLIEDVDRDVDLIGGGVLRDIGVEIGRYRAASDQMRTDARRTPASVVDPIAFAVLMFRLWESYL